MYFIIGENILFGKTFRKSFRKINIGDFDKKVMNNTCTLLMVD